MDKKKKIGAMALSMAFLVMALGGYVNQAEVNAEVKDDMVFVFGSGGDAVRLDPADVTDGESIQRMDNIFEGLVEYMPGSTEIEPCLAESWEISEDGLEMTFHLRENVRFHDGTKFNASAVVFSFARQYDVDHLYNQYGEWPYWSYMFSDIKEAVEIDEYTVKIIMKQPNASIMTSLAMFTVCIVSPTNAEKWKDDAFKHPCGTGPFKFVEWKKDDHITLVANEDYWRERAQIDTLIFRVMSDPSQRLMALMTNQIQGMEYPMPEDFAKIESNPDLKLLSQPGMNVGYMAMNTGYGYVDANKNGVRDPDEPWEKTPGYLEPLTDKRVRQAINYAIDKQAIVDYIYLGTASVAVNGMPPSLVGHNDEVEDYIYNPGKAEELLAEAGYPDGFSVTLWVMPVQRPYMLDPPAIAEAIQAYLGAVGIKVSLYQIDWATYLQKTQAGEHNMCMLGWTGDNGDPDNFLNVLYGPNSACIGVAGNRAFYIRWEVQELLTKALRTYDMDERIKYYEEAQALIHEDAGWVYIAHANQNLAFRSNVHGYVLHPTSRKFFYPIWLE